MTHWTCRRCDWEPVAGEGSPRSQLLEHRVESGHPLCVLCSTSLPGDRPMTCLPCLAEVRQSLVRVVELYALLRPAMLGGAFGEPGKPRSDGGGSRERALPGGDVLVLSGPGALGPSGLGAPRRWVPLWRCLRCGTGGHEDRGRHLLETHGSTAWTTVGDLFADDDGRWVDVEGPAEQPGDPESVAFELCRWEDDWRQVRGEPAAETVGTVASAAGYLERRMGWAADEHLAFDEFAEDVRRLLTRLRTATATDDHPEAGAPCFEEGCGGTLVREWTEQGLSESWRCPRCRRVYEPAAYWLAVKAEMEHRRAMVDWVPLQEAVDASRRPAKTLRTWVSRMQVGAACRVRDRALVVWWPDVYERVFSTERRASRRRSA